MPTYNCAEYISAAIKSILNQTYKDFEFLIIDDGSTDSTKEIVSRFNDSRINFIQKEHTGFAESLNYGLKIAKYDLIARMDADDLSHPYRLEKQICFFKNNNRIDVLSSWFAVFSNRGIEYIVKTPTQHKDIVKGFLLYSHIHHPSCLFRKDLILNHGGYFGDVFEDYILWLKIMKNVVFENIPEFLHFYRFRSDSLSRLNINIKNNIHYSIQEPYYNNLNFYFNIRDNTEENSYKGWREYFYGDKSRARKYWMEKPKSILRDYRISLAFIITYLPNRFLVIWKENRIRYRIKYILTFLSRETRQIRNDFKKLIRREAYTVHLKNIRINAIPENHKVVLYADFNVLNYLYESKLEIPDGFSLYPDSLAVYLINKYFLRINVSKFVSTDFQNELLVRLDEMALKVFFFGDTSTVLKRLINNVKRNYPKIKICGTHEGYNFNSQEVIQEINMSKSEILFVGLGACRQEEWIVNNYHKLNVNFIFSVGGWFQYLAGSKKRAPKFIRDLHLEWVHKLLMEYGRVWKRYLFGAPLFFYRIITKKIIIDHEK
jgi:exopolysaccharide biosynthesis WecB/TagA/CpsF family protein